MTLPDALDYIPDEIPAYRHKIPDTYQLYKEEMQNQLREKNRQALELIHRVLRRENGDKMLIWYLKRNLPDFELNRWKNVKDGFGVSWYKLMALVEAMPGVSFKFENDMWVCYKNDLFYAKNTSFGLAIIAGYLVWQNDRRNAL